jgi:hypothetical protein
MHAYLMSSSPVPPMFCQKSTFETRREAQRHIKKFGTQNVHLKPVASAAASGKTFGPYRCNGCGLWHLGHA